MKRHNTVRTVNARNDEWIVVKRSGPPSDDSAIFTFLLYVAGIWALFAIAKVIVGIISAVVSAVMAALLWCITILLWAGAVFAIIWINAKALKVLRGDVGYKSWWKIGSAAAIWILVSFWIFGGLEPWTIEKFTTYNKLEEGMLWWKRTISVPQVDQGKVTLTFWAYWLSASLPLYAAISLAIHFFAAKIQSTKSNRQNLAESD